MLEPVTFIPRSKPPTLVRIWMPYLIISIFNLLLSFLSKNPLGIFCFCEIFWFVPFLFLKSEIKIVITIEEKTFQYYYMNCWGKEKVVVVDIFTAEGSYKYIRISSSKFGWQLKIRNDKHNKITISQGTFEKFQLDQMVRMINQIKKGIFIADVGTEF